VVYWVIIFAIFVKKNWKKLDTMTPPTQRFCRCVWCDQGCRDSQLCRCGQSVMGRWCSQGGEVLLSVFFRTRSTEMCMHYRSFSPKTDWNCFRAEGRADACFIHFDRGFVHKYLVGKISVSMYIYIPKS
jgi:hypothetical protein